jgi:hypothetical protein
LKTALDELKNMEYQLPLKKDKELILDIYDRMFDHQSFTGRSGTFYKYEGLGCIYWHMVSKLLLAVQEVILQAHQKNEKEEIVKQLVDHYYKIREGIGIHKFPSTYGAFPTDPYSHTPGNMGVQQPGMSGQVKEDIISRFGELGVLVEEGKITFRPVLLRKKEFLRNPKSYQFIDLGQAVQRVDLAKGTLVFTFCKVPIAYHLSRLQKIHITKENGDITEIQGLSLDQEISSSIFNRKGEVLKLDVFLPLKIKFSEM